MYFIMDRRQFLAISGISIAGLAGCTGGNEEMEGGDHNSGGDSENPSTTSTTTSDTTSTPTETSTATSTPEPEANVAIKNSELQTKETSYRTEAYVIATIVNKGQGISGEVTAKARFYDESENLLDDMTASLPYLKPGETWKAYLPYLDDGQKVKSHKIDGEFKSETPNLEPDGVSIQDTKLQKGDYDASVTGTLVNNLEETANYFAAHVRFWKDDVILAAGLDNQTDIPAGENWSFEAGYTGYGDRWKEATDFDAVPEVTIY